MRLLSRNLLVGLGTAGLVATFIVACGSDDGSKFGDGSEDQPGFTDGGFNPDVPGADVDLYANDPPPKWCGPGAQNPPPPPGGTEECPDDKNKPGCGCLHAGEQAPCWTGLRKHRGLGICKDGVATCIQKTENTTVWGECEGQVLPNPSAVSGKDACGCFSLGQWKIANISPCSFVYCNIDPGAGNDCPVANITATVALSTIVDGNGVSKCPPQPQTAPTTAPTERWSTDTLKVDCAGHFKLCYRIRAGNFDAPSASDCILGEVCTEADYVKENVEQAWPDLPGWIGADQACAKKWALTAKDQSAGYGEMVVKGQSVRCDNIDDGKGGDLVFNRVKYCPAICRDAANASNPVCVACQQSGQGEFK